VAFHFGVGREADKFLHKNSACYELLHRVADLERCFGMTQAFEYGHGIWNMVCEESLLVCVTEESCKKISKV
jgi:hypothetical protein